MPVTLESLESTLLPAPSRPISQKPPRLWYLFHPGTMVEAPECSGIQCAGSPPYQSRSPLEDASISLDRVRDLTLASASLLQQLLPRHQKLPPTALQFSNRLPLHSRLSAYSMQGSRAAENCSPKQRRVSSRHRHNDGCRFRGRQDS